ncbi:hypothetical protein B5X24_HaOG202331 [Helicoverpa armigera]|uniref:Peroxidase n=1 Tax=Helicoverpa armigera TaxID=29058 RepID=A0A2W1BT77_HELAM|nr:hypothetical protein B5X24_HaOG202331 [Helicoverpa armigera]
MDKTFISFLIISIALGVLGDSSYYSSFYGLVLNSTQVAEYTANSTLANCTILVEACNSTEGRRIDGTCNNLNHPSYGGTRTPYYRILSASYYKPSKSEFEPRHAVGGGKLSVSRKVRTTIYSEGRVDDENLSSIINHLAVFFATDITNTRDTTNYVTWRPYCCKEAGKTDYACTPNKVPADDYVHRFSGIHCLNMTRPLTFQTSGCLANTTTPLRIVDATPILDLSPIYGNTVEPARRTNSSGQLVTVTANNRTFPDTSTLKLLLGINFVGIILFWNNHNFIASELATVNPCWTDDQLFETAREINIAYGTQMFYYELMATLMGKDNLINDGIILNGTGFRDVYNSSVLPQIALEYPVVLRWMHSLQDGELRMYYTNGTYKSTFPIVDLTSNTDFLKENSTMDYVTQGFIRQPTGNSKDYIADPDIVQRGLGGLQKSNDIMTNDLAKNRYFGFQGYISYRNYCFGDNITSFDNLTDIIDEERITQLKSLYANVADVDLLAGIWVERKKADSYVPPTFYCIVAEQLKRSLVSDRHWYERSTRPNAFTAAQLAEIRKATAARMLCDIGAGITEVQPRAFELPGSDNVIVSCDEIPALNYTMWQDSTCT